MQNLMVLRFRQSGVSAHVEPPASCRTCRNRWKEDLESGWGAAVTSTPRGIIRDVIQNHLIQMVASGGMEPPARSGSHIAFATRRSRFSACIPPLVLHDR